ncbi:hypothetical protein CONLIGDRAFT_671387 [Coniochaeta ligniaria NRRL 30616]|uniref:Cora-domain-containing protein n=1 Tax=Coniochaeta ligniaria NRRL 30616 TaxID=1408157 RepID=A0A1J7JJ27_9PEZI|nr:hypothetical protein CONLIGDRAFT_671387 [Coniochaeta ligniaria NRRL 30616]
MASGGSGFGTPRSDLFLFDRQALRGDILLHEGKSRIDYHEYAVFRVPEKRPETLQPGSAHGPSTDPRPRHVSHSIGPDDPSSDKLFDLALRQGHGLNAQGEFVKLEDGYDSTLEGRVRHIICHRQVKSEDGFQDGLSITDEDFDLLDLHPATLQYVRRTTTESMFWDRRHEKLSLIISFSSDPRAPFDYLSMTYSIPDRLTTVLIRQSYDPHLHGIDDVDEYAKRMEACRSHWTHPLVTPVVLLQVQFARTEMAVAENNNDVNKLEQDVGAMAGFEAFERRDGRRRTNSFQTKGGFLSAPLAPKKTTQLMKAAHDVLKRAIQLLDTIRWMERAVSILLDGGDGLGDIIFDPDEGIAAPEIIVPVSMRRRSFSGLSRERIRSDPIASHWHEIRQYLEGLSQFCKSLGMDRHMLEVRCKAQIDIIYAKMAQEDNNLNARMAVASTRDSSSMKALAVITALFLPGDFMASLFGMSMFDWQDVGDDDSDASPANASEPKHPIVTSRFWVYWSITLPLTITILCIWRAWWVAQDRHFRKHLSRDLSEERFYTDDGRPRDLERSFIYDFFYLSVRRDERPGGTSGTLSASTSMSRSSDDGWDKVTRGSRIPTVQHNEMFDNTDRRSTFRLRQIAFANVSKPGDNRTGNQV